MELRHQNKGYVHVTLLEVVGYCCYCLCWFCMLGNFFILVLFIAFTPFVVVGYACYIYIFCYHYGSQWKETLVIQNSTEGSKV